MEVCKYNLEYRKNQLVLEFYDIQEYGTHGERYFMRKQSSDGRHLLNFMFGYKKKKRDKLKDQVIF